MLIELSTTDLCFVDHLFWLVVWVTEGFQELSDPGSGALGLALKQVTLPLQDVLGLCSLLEPDAQVSISLNQVIRVLQKAFSSDSLSAHGP